MALEEAAKIAAQCRHYAMCKIDFLGTGLCQSGAENCYVSYFPQGRMDIYHALAQGQIPVTEGLVDITETCNLCGICDKQCYFVTELRPLKVMKALKDYVENHLAAGNKIERSETDPVLGELKRLVGNQWASNDPAILTAYATDPGPFTGQQMPKYVVLPESKEEISEIVRLIARYEIPYAVRGNGSSVMGLVFAKDGLVMDLVRMKKLSIDKENWCASVEPGVSAYELQRAAEKHGLRANLAEPAALVCANIMCSGIFSTFSNAYGTAADNFIDAEFVDQEGKIFSLSQRDTPNLYGFQFPELPSPPLCTRVDIKLHPVSKDEEGLLVPFAGFFEAATFARDLSQRRIGLAVAVLGLEYIAVFASPTNAVAQKVRKIFKENLGIEFAVLVIGDKWAIDAVENLAETVIDQNLLKTLLLGIPRMVEENLLNLLESGHDTEVPYKLLFQKDMLPLFESALKTSPEDFAKSVDPDLQDFYADLYSRPEMTDMVWLNTFRIISSRMGREKHVVAFIVYLPLDRMEIVMDINNGFGRIGNKHKVKHDYGFLTPLDLGKRAVLEYDYYLDHTDPVEVEAMQKAIMEVGAMLEKYSREQKGVMWIKNVFNQGFARKEGFLYR